MGSGVTKDNWRSFSWYCPNCTAPVSGCQNKNGMVKLECEICKFVMVRTPMGKNGHTIRVFPPESDPA